MPCQAISFFYACYTLMSCFQFRNISLKYAPSLPPALDGVSFKLPHAAKVGVVGRTGSGKSTLLVALFRLIQPCDGAIVLDGRSTLVRLLLSQCPRYLQPRVCEVLLLAFVMRLS